MNAGELASERNFVKAAGQSKYRTNEQKREATANLQRVYRDRLECPETQIRGSYGSLNC